MYVNPVVVGVVGTLIVELLIVIGLVIWKYDGTLKKIK